MDDENGSYADGFLAPGLGPDCAAERRQPQLQQSAEPELHLRCGGNVKSIVDVVNSSQRQCYNYDALHRLLRGFTTGATTCNNNPNSVGSGPFDETTTYQDVLGGRGGNVTSKSGVGNYTYGVAQAADCPEGALVKANAVVAAGSNYLFYCYDQNGSLRRRKVGSSTTATYGYDAENRLVSVSGAAVATFVYDGDGNRVKATFGATTTIYVGNTYERDNGSTVRKYYYAGGVRVAMRSGGQTYHLLSDHLGGTNVTANSSGAQISKLLYRPWGETRYSSGSTPTTWRFTGQREDATIGLYYFNARYLDPQLGRFTQPDTIVPEPGNPQALNRYSYVTNRPTIAIDPTGHDLMIVGGAGGDLDIAIWQQWIVEYKGWSLEQWNKFHATWNAAQDLDAKNEVLAAEGVGVFNWGGTTWDEAKTNAHSETTISMVDELASQMAGMKDVTLVGWSKGGNLVLQYLWAQEQGRLKDAVIPVRAVLLAPGTHPAGPILGASWVRNEVPGGWPTTVNICSHGDRACPLTIRNAVWNINPPWNGNFHGPHGRFAASVIDALNVAGHHQARPRLPG